MHWDVIQLWRGMKSLAAVSSYPLDKFETCGKKVSEQSQEQDAMYMQLR